MARDRNAFRAGLFIVVSVALIVAVVIGIQGFERLFQSRQVRTARFKLTDDLSGLRVGDEVRVGGLKQGEVRDIEVVGHDTAPTDDDHLLVTFTLPERIVLRGEPGLRVQSTITGTVWLNLDHLGTGEPLARGDVITGQPGTMTVVLETLSAVAPDLVGTVRDVRTTTLPRVHETVASFKDAGDAAAGLVRRVDTRVDPIAEKVANVADRTGEVMVEARDVLGDTKTDVRGTMANLNAGTGTLKDRLPGLLDRADAVLARVQSAVDGTNEALVDVRAVMANSRDVTESLRGILVGNRGKIENMVDALKTTGDNLKAASASIRHSPWRLLYKPGKGEMANLNLYDSARQFAEGAGDLNDAATALRDALHDPTVEPARLEELVKQLDTTFAGFKEVENELWNRVRD
jgi:phospholipid/cholesterol/gamma-HCH transport system substrate-binding protein